MKKGRLIGGIALTFVLGVLAGSAGTKSYYHYRAEHTWNNPTERRAYYLRRLTEELGLSQEQQREFKTLIDEMETRREAMFAERRAEIRKNLEEVFSRMKERLDPAQQQKLDRLRAGYEKRMKTMRRPPRMLF
jgi:DNA anti-recombination protein RmuC